MSGDRSKIIAFNYFGAKFTIVEELYKYFPQKKQFTHLVDVFGGSLAVSLNYNGQVIKTANEINNDITNFFKVLREQETELINLLELTPCSKSEFDNCWEKTNSDLENARRFYVRIRQSFYGLGVTRKSKGFHMTKTHVNAQGGETVSRWKNALPKLRDVAKIIRNNMQITNYDCFTCIDKIDFNKAFFYCDPPYVHGTRSGNKDYKYEFTDNQHIELANKLKAIKGLAMVSGYNSELYDKLYKDWTKVELPIRTNHIRSSEVQEVIWFNYPIEKTQNYHDTQIIKKKYGTPLAINFK